MTRTNCAYCGKRLAQGQKRHCSALCRKREAEYQREYQSAHQRTFTDAQREAARERTREWKRRKQELRNKPKPVAVKLVGMKSYPSPWWCGGVPTGHAMSDGEYFGIRRLAK